LEKAVRDGLSSDILDVVNDLGREIMGFVLDETKKEKEFSNLDG
jgi:hypothetical protein